MDARIGALNVEIDKLKIQVTKVHQMLDPENFRYNLLESQFETLKVRNQQIASENAKAEQRIKDAMDASDKIMEDAKSYESHIKSQVLVLHQKAMIKYREIEESLAIKEKRKIEKHLADLEQTVA